jgi:hypothetical protein
MQEHLIITERLINETKIFESFEFIGLGGYFQVLRCRSDQWLGLLPFCTAQRPEILKIVASILPGNAPGYISKFRWSRWMTTMSVIYL